MPSIRRYIDDGDALQRFSAQIDREIVRAQQAVAKIEDGPLCAVAFLYVDDSEALFDYAYAWRAADRDRLRNELEDDPGAVWQPADWGIEFDEDMPDAVGVAESSLLAALLQDAGAEMPAQPFLRDLCLNLNRCDWAGVIETTDDFVVWPNEHELTDLPVDAFKELAGRPASSAVRASLMGRRWRTSTCPTGNGRRRCCWPSE